MRFLLLFLAVTSISHGSTDHKRARTVNEIKDLVKCSRNTSNFEAKQLIDLEVEQVLDKMSPQLYAFSGTKGGGNYDSLEKSYHGCQSELSFDEVLTTQQSREKFYKIAEQIKEVFPRIDLREDYENTQLCLTTDSLKAIGSLSEESISRKAVWLPAVSKDSKAHVVFGDRDGAFKELSEDEKIDILLKESIHRYTPGSNLEFRKRSAVGSFIYLKEFTSDQSVLTAEELKQKLEEKTGFPAFTQDTELELRRELDYLRFKLRELQK